MPNCSPEAGADFLLHTPVVGPLSDGGRVSGVRLLTKQGMAVVRARVIVDATGDGDVAFGAGAAYDQGRDAGASWDAGRPVPAHVHHVPRIRR